MKSDEAQKKADLAVDGLKSLLEQSQEKVQQQKEQISNLEEEIDFIKADNSYWKLLYDKMMEMTIKKDQPIIKPASEESKSSEQTSPSEVSWLTLVGDSVGKTSLLSKMRDSDFQGPPEHTTFIDRFQFEKEFQAKTVCLNSFDISCQEKFIKTALNYLNAIQCIILLYDITSVESLRRCQYWMDVIKEEEITGKIIYLIGNKTDLGSQREVSAEKANEFKFVNDIDFYFEVSAKTGEGVNSLVQHV
mmetsp:Transcript_16651/g.16333  ORF Transcript_16651/g.16333 Transcript_16651/m.16333 type:complete len:247 (+) Transcript_16651:666-1406(+)